VTALVAELSDDDLANYLVWRLIVTFYPSKYSDETRRRETCLKQTEEVFGPVSLGLRSTVRIVEPDYFI
jgi:hypothetical protein